MCFGSILEIYFTLIFLTSHRRYCGMYLLEKHLLITRNKWLFIVLYPIPPFKHPSLFLKSKGIRLVYSHPALRHPSHCKGEGPGMGLNS